MDKLGSINIKHRGRSNFQLWLLWISLVGYSTALPFPQLTTEQEFESNDVNGLVNCGGEFGAPLITPCKDSLKLEAGSNYTLRCEAEQPIVWWHIPNGRQDSRMFHNVEDPQRPFGIELHLEAVNADYVGAYYCVTESELPEPGSDWPDEKLVELVNSNMATSIYIFVHDDKQLLVPTSTIVDVPQYTDVVIPCKPTMPDIEVLLTFNGETYSSETSGRYDPRRGFIVEIRGVPDSGEYICRPKVPAADNEEESTMTTVYFTGNKDSDKADININKPTIKSKSRGHIYEGGSFELACELSAPPQIRYSIEWVLPINANPEHIDSKSPSHFDNSQKNSTHILGRKTLKVHNASHTETGTYKCIVSHQTNQQTARYQMNVMKPNSSYLDIKEPSNHYKVSEKANKTIQITAAFRGFPYPTLKWYKPDGSEIWETERKFEIISTETTTTLKVENAQLLDSGQYRLKGTNGYDTKQLKFDVCINSKPIVSVADVYVEAGSEAYLRCSVKSCPTPLVNWVFTPCSIQPRWPSCDKKFDQTFNHSRNVIHEDLSIEYIHELYFTPKQPGIVTCVAQNKIGHIEAIAKGHVLIGDIKENISITGLDESHKIARGDDISFTCAALVYHYVGDLEWYRDGELVTEGPNVKVETNNTDYSYRKTLRFQDIRFQDEGNYECRARHVLNMDEYDSRDIKVTVREPTRPQWEDSKLMSKSKVERNLGESLELSCRSHAIPVANVRWYKDNAEVLESNLTHILEDETKLLITHLYPMHDGTYKCIVANRLGSIESSTTVVIANMPGRNGLVTWLVVIFCISLAILAAFFGIRYRHERKRHLELKAAGLANFEEGAVDHINPALSLDEQADLLPYDRGFEFPREKLKLGKQLGAGAFGVVLKGEAEGILNDGVETTVAVKMVKRTADNEVVRALVSELKIMVHLGQHLNVVNLLGAVTKNIAKRELMVIVEYCRFGNIQNFLLRNRKCFINQIHPTTNKIDPTIMTQRISENFELHRDGRGGVGGLKYVNLSFTNHHYINHMNNNNVNNNYTHNHRRNSDNDPRSGTRAGRPGSAGYSYERQTDSCATEATVMTTVPEDDDHVMSNNSIQPAWRSNYKTDSTEAMTLTTSHLISWAFQVSRGMDYLSSKKVLHGDLAARNILLCDNNVVKICDFGLARSMYRGDNYKKTGDARLPIKWLALESLSDHVFSTYTDVWSFGIVLWELFSLAKVPYPGIDPNQDLFLKLKDGFRMEKPPYANDDLYDIMLECWRTNPESRPLFNVLEKRFAEMLGDDVTNHYVDLNDPYMRSNTEYMKGRPTDFLALMGSPDEFAPAPPRYVNGHILPEIRIEASPDDYLQMNAENTTAIFSPTRPKGDEVQVTEFEGNPAIKTIETSFTFPDSRNVGQHSPTLANNIDSNAHKPLRKKNGLPTVDSSDKPPEEIPMLHRTSTSDGEQSPEQSRRFANELKQQQPTPSPRHHVETKLNGDNENYVNVKPPRKTLPNKSVGAGADAFSNPSYQPLNTLGEQEERRY